MFTLILMLSVGALYSLAYNTYGKFLAQKIFKLRSAGNVPSKQFEDNKDFIPSKKSIVFGHHFTSIAGTGPIVGPAIGVIWGWLPVILWVLFGSIFMGAVHDLSSTVMSLRNNGMSVIEIANKLLGKRIKWIFFAIVFIALWIVIAIFGLVIALIFKQFPTSVLPVWAEIPIAILLGLVTIKAPKKRRLVATISKLTFLGLILLGVFFPVELTQLWGIPATGLWTILLLIYAFIASLLPVNLLMQPRDYLNAWQLYFVMALLGIGVVGSAMSLPFEMVAPAIQLSPQGAPPMLPFLFITIACGAISGFHSLVASGTTSKQIENEMHALPIGYGAMLVEGMLATLIIIAVTAGIGLGYMKNGELLTGLTAWNSHYSSWGASSGLGSKLAAVVQGAANMLNAIGIPHKFGIIIMGVFIASFAGTTLDTSTRIQRYIISEACRSTRFSFISKPIIATLIAVLSGAGLAFSSGANGKGALLLWPLFGAVNQLLAALALMLASIYLHKKGGVKYLVTFIPFLVIIGITMWASTINQITFIQNKNQLLAIINGMVMALSLWMLFESLIKYKEKIND